MNRHRNDPRLHHPRDASAEPGYDTAANTRPSRDMYAGADDYEDPARAASRYRHAAELRSHAGVQRGAYGRYDEDDAMPRGVYAGPRDESGWGYGDDGAERGLGSSGRGDGPGRRQPYAQPDRQRGDYLAHFGHERGHGHDVGYVGGGVEPAQQGPRQPPGYAEEQGDARHGSGAYGRPRGQPGEDFRGRGPKGYVRSDERVREDVSQLLSDDPQVDASDIDVAVQNGKVTLSGQVSERWAKHRAEDLCAHCAGVVEIDNRIGVKRD